MEGLKQITMYSGTGEAHKVIMTLTAIYIKMNGYQCYFIVLGNGFNVKETKSGTIERQNFECYFKHNSVMIICLQEKILKTV